MSAPFGAARHAHGSHTRSTPKRARAAAHGGAPGAGDAPEPEPESEPARPARRARCAAISSRENATSGQPWRAQHATRPGSRAFASSVATTPTSASDACGRRASAARIAASIASAGAPRGSRCRARRASSGGRARVALARESGAWIGSNHAVLAFGARLAGRASDGMGCVDCAPASVPRGKPGVRRARLAPCVGRYPGWPRAVPPPSHPRGQWREGGMRDARVAGGLPLRGQHRLRGRTASCFPLGRTRECAPGHRTRAYDSTARAAAGGARARHRRRRAASAAMTFVRLDAPRPHGLHSLAFRCSRAVSVARSQTGNRERRRVAARQPVLPPQR